MNPSTWEPPFQSRMMSRSLGERSLPNAYALQSTHSFQMTNLYLLEEFQKYCYQVSQIQRDKQSRYESNTEQTIKRLGYLFGMPHTTSYTVFKQVFNYVAAHNRTFGMPPEQFYLQSTKYYDKLSRAAMLSYLGSIDDSSLHIARLRTNDIYTTMKHMTDRFDESGKVMSGVKAKILHTSVKTFVTVMSMLNITSKSCNHDIINNLPTGNNPVCEGYPMPSSSLVFEFYHDNSGLEGRWSARAIYNGAHINMCGSREAKCDIDLFMAVMKASMWSANEDYYCDLSPNEFESDRRERYLLMWLFVAIFVLMMSICMFFAGRTVIKTAEVELEYLQKQNVLHFANIEYLSEERRNSRSINGSFL